MLDVWYHELCCFYIQLPHYTESSYERGRPWLMLHFVYHFKQNCVHDLTFNLRCQMCRWVYSRDVAATAGRLLLTPHLMWDKLPWLVM